MKTIAVILVVTYAFTTGMMVITVIVQTDFVGASVLPDLHRLATAWARIALAGG